MAMLKRQNELLEMDRELKEAGHRRDTLLNRKDQLLKSAYYEVARNGAKIQNYLAQSIVDGAKK